MSRIVIISNRLPVFLEKEQDSWKLSPSSGGVATGLQSLDLPHEQLWIGWPGVAAETLSDSDRASVNSQLAQQHCLGVHLTKTQVEQFYEGFCNKTIWPLFHYFTQYASYEKDLWDAYNDVNREFCRVTLETVTPEDTIWVHDYQLMLLPQMLRENMPDARIGFFLHIPFPSWELFRLLPWRSDILRGMLGADLVAFHTYDYARHFLTTASKMLGIEHTLGRLNFANRLVKVDAFPMGINYERFARGAQEPAAQKELEAISRAVAGGKLIISIDRLDYSKGILRRVEAFEAFLAQNEQYHGKVKLLLLAVPSRSGVADYAMLREQLERLVGKVNGQYGSVEWTPIQYLYRPVSFEQLCAFYAAADIALVTPLRDGMNLIAKEFIAARADGSGVLILSEMAGAASELGEAIIVNANDKQGVADAIKLALEMPLEEQQGRNRMMQRRLRRYDIGRWASDFLQSLEETISASRSLQMVRFARLDMQALEDAFAKSYKRLLLLDYDGTLLGFANRPEGAVPDKELLDMLEQLVAEKKNTVVILSGRDKDTLGKWLGGMGAGLVAEHGAWRQDKGGVWRAAEGLRSDWKETVRNVLDLYADRTPGAIVEEKDFSLVWHYRAADLGMAQSRLSEMKAALMHLTQNQNLSICEGNRILEIRSASINKGTAAQTIVAEGGWDFILAAGDDYTDEDMFKALPSWAYSLKVGYGGSAARFSVGGVRQFRSILEELAGKEYAAHR